jgi:excisionase family DNA binding protein
MSNNGLKLLTRKQVCDLFALPSSTLDYLVSTSQIPFVRITKRNVRFREDELLKWLETRRDLPYRRAGADLVENQKGTGASGQPA